jgi:hypothetical protein
MKPVTKLKQALLMFQEEFEVANNCNAYRAPNRLTDSAEQKNTTLQLIHMKTQDTGKLQSRGH